MLEGKIQIHSRLAAGVLDDSVFDKFYSYAEENALPLLLRLGDPLSFRDKTKVSQYAVKQGWVCSESDPTLEDLRREIENVLKKFPKLRLIIAHFNFMSDDLDRVAKLFDTYENLCYDLTQGGEMFVNFTKNPEQTKEFFIKYQDRLLFDCPCFADMPKDISALFLLKTIFSRNKVFNHSHRQYRKNSTRDI